MFTLLTLIQRGFCAEKYAKLAQSKTMLVLRLRHRKVNKTSNIKAWLMNRNKICTLLYLLYDAKYSKIHSPNLVHLQCTTRIKFFYLQTLDWPVIPVSAWEQVTPFSLSLPKQNSWSAGNLSAKPDMRPQVFWFFQQITLVLYLRP